MPRLCSVCTHPNRGEIDRALVAGGSLRGVAGQHGLNDSSVARHKADHLPRLLAQAHDAADIAHADDLLTQLRDLQVRTLGLLDQAETAGRLGTAVMAIREARGNIELLGRLMGEIDDRPQFNLVVAPEWLALRGRIVVALAPYPEARTAVAEALDAG